MFRRILFQMPIIKQIHNRSLENKARKKVEEAIKEVFGLPNIKETGEVEELNRLIKKGLAEKGIKVKGDLKIYKKAYRCRICNSMFDKVDGDDGLEKHLEIVHLISLSKGGKR